ncbi:hypothetical protein JCM11491_003711 [Sporobolomyces phaffii]
MMAADSDAPSTAHQSGPPDAGPPPVPASSSSDRPPRPLPPLASAPAFASTSDPFPRPPRPVPASPASSPAIPASTSADSASDMLFDHLVNVTLTSPSIPFAHEPEEGRVDRASSSQSLSSSSQPEQHPHRAYGDHIDRLRYVIFVPDLNKAHGDLVDTFLRKSLGKKHIGANDRATVGVLRKLLDAPVRPEHAAKESQSCFKVHHMGQLLLEVVKILDEVISPGARDRDLEWVSEPTSRRWQPRPDLSFGEIVKDLDLDIKNTLAVCEIIAFTAGMLKSGIAWKLHEQLEKDGGYEVDDVVNWRKGWTETTSSLLLELASATIDRKAEYMFILTGAGYQMAKLREIDACDSTDSKTYDLLVGPLACFKYKVAWQPGAEGEGGMWADSSEHQNEPSLLKILLGLFYKEAFDAVDKTYREQVPRASSKLRNQKEEEEEERGSSKRTRPGDERADSIVEEDLSGAMQESDGTCDAPSGLEDSRRTPLHTFEFADGCVPAHFFEPLDVSRAFADTLAEPSGLMRDDPPSLSRPHDPPSSRGLAPNLAVQLSQYSSSALVPSVAPPTMPPRPFAAGAQPSSLIDDTLVLYPGETTTPQSDLRSSRPRAQLITDHRRVDLALTINLTRRLNSDRTLTSDVYRSIPPGLVVKFAKNRGDRHVEAENEASVLLNHLAVDSLRPFIVQLLYFAKNPDNRYDKVVSVFEDGGDSLEGWFEASMSDDDRHHLAVGLHLVRLHGVQHRDLKPANVVRRPGEPPKLIDFGNARSRHHCPVGTCEELSEFLEDLGMFAEVDRAAVRDRAQQLFALDSA